MRENGRFKIWSNRNRQGKVFSSLEGRKLQSEHEINKFRSWEGVSDRWLKEEGLQSVEPVEWGRGGEVRELD